MKQHCGLSTGQFRIAIRALALALSLACEAQDRAATPSAQLQAPVIVNLTVNSGRPVAEAVKQLEDKYGWIITYEDPRYVHEGNIKDVTEKVRRDMDQYPPGQAPRVLVPKGGSFKFSYSVSSVLDKPEDPAALLQALLEAAGDQFGGFRSLQTGQVFHVVPAKVKNEGGAWVEQGSILDIRINLPEKERSGGEMLREICAALSKATQLTVTTGLTPRNLLSRYRAHDGAVNETTRTVLLRTLEGTNRKLSWQLFYDPGLQWYALNIHAVPEKQAP